MRRGVIEASALLGAAGTFWYYRLRDDAPTPSDRASSPSSAVPAPAPMGSDGSPLQLVSVQVAFRHGARMPNHDVLHPREVGSTGPVAWTAHDATLDPGTGVRFVLRDYKGNELPGGASNKRILNSSRKLEGGAVAGQLSTLGWHQMIEFGQTLRHRYLGRPGPSSLMRAGEQSLPPNALLTRCDANTRSLLPMILRLLSRQCCC